MKLCFDLDNTLCHTPNKGNGSYWHSTPKEGAAELLLSLKAQGHTIIISTARGMERTNNDQLAASQIMREVTLDQLRRWGFTFDEFYVGIKPSADLYIDDKAVVGVDLDQVKETLDGVLDHGSTVQSSSQPCHCTRVECERPQCRDR